MGASQHTSRNNQICASSPDQSPSIVLHITVLLSDQDEKQQHSTSIKINQSDLENLTGQDLLDQIASYCTTELGYFNLRVKYIYSEQGFEIIDYLLSLKTLTLEFLADNDRLIAKVEGPSEDPLEIVSSKRQVTLTDFKIIKPLGTGGFASVLLVRKKDSGELFALKTIDKSKIKQFKKIETVMNERNIYASTSHPFILKMHATFQTSKYLFFVLDFCPGGELFFHVQLNDVFSCREAKFIFAETLLAIEHLHKSDIIYRDLKPENILLDAEGHVRLADFGLSKMNFGSDERSYSFCGSPEYMSPEMVTHGSNHSRMIDLYQLGCLLYEMLVGLPPFYCKNKRQMFQNITGSKAHYPSSLDQDANDLIQKLLVKDPSQRLGAAKGIQELKEHPFCQGIDWLQLLAKNIKPPYKPQYRASNFDLPPVNSPFFKDLLAHQKQQEQKDRSKRQPKLSFQEQRMQAQATAGTGKSISKSVGKQSKQTAKKSLFRMGLRANVLSPSAQRKSGQKEPTVASVESPSFRNFTYQFDRHTQERILSPMSQASGGQSLLKVQAMNQSAQLMSQTEFLVSEVEMGPQQYRLDNLKMEDVDFNIKEMGGQVTSPVCDIYDSEFEPTMNTQRLHSPASVDGYQLEPNVLIFSNKHCYSPSTDQTQGRQASQQCMETGNCFTRDFQEYSSSPKFPPDSHSRQQLPYPSPFKCVFDSLAYKTPFKRTPKDRVQIDRHSKDQRQLSHQTKTPETAFKKSKTLKAIADQYYKEPPLEILGHSPMLKPPSQNSQAGHSQTVDSRFNEENQKSTSSLMKPHVENDLGTNKSQRRSCEGTMLSKLFQQYAPVKANRKATDQISNFVGSTDCSTTNWDFGHQIGNRLTNNSLNKVSNIKYHKASLQVTHPEVDLSLTSQNSSSLVRYSTNPFKPNLSSYASQLGSRSSKDLSKAKPTLATDGLSKRQHELQKLIADGQLKDLQFTSCMIQSVEK